MSLVLLLLACDPWATWPDPESVYPFVFTPETGLPPYADVRVETETWVPLVDLEQTGLYILKSFEHRPGAPQETLLHFGEQRRQTVPPNRAHLVLDFAGDLLPVVGVDTSATQRLFSGDLALANLETPTAPFAESVGGVYAFNTDPAFLDGLPFDVLQLNNNHSLDAGEEGLAQTAVAVRRRGMVAVGASDHALVTVRGTSVAILTYTWGLNVPTVTAPELFVLPFGHLEPIDLSRVRGDVVAARERGADLVVVMAHWGYEYEYYPTPLQMQRARELVVAGADLVVGHGPHVAQPAEICTVDQPRTVPGVGTCSLRSEDNRPRVAAVLYSLGNFTSDMLTVPTQVGLVASVSLHPDDGVTGLEWSPVVNLDTEAGPVVAPLEEHLDREQLAAESARLNAHIGTRWRRDAP